MIEINTVVEEISDDKSPDKPTDSENSDSGNDNPSTDEGEKDSNIDQDINDDRENNEDVKQEETKEDVPENPKTGVELPIIILTALRIISYIFVKMSKKKEKIYKI